MTRSHPIEVPDLQLSCAGATHRPSSLGNFEKYKSLTCLGTGKQGLALDAQKFARVQEEST